MNAIKVAVPFTLSNIVNGIFLYTNDHAASTHCNLPVFADGCPGIVFHEADDGLYLNNTRQLEPLFIYGQGVKPLELTTRGRLQLLVFVLQPYALKSMFAIDAHHITDSCISMQDILPAATRPLLEQLSEARTAGKRIAIISSFILRLSENAVETQPDIQYAVRLIITNNGLIPLQSLQNELRVTERTFQRRFEQHIGVSPKLFCRICQFQASISQLTTQGFDKLSDVAYHNGYADQSHFIRVFKEFTSYTPREYLRIQTLQLIPAAGTQGGHETFLSL